MRVIIEMEDSKVTGLEEEEKVTDEKKPPVSYHYLYPCDLLEEAVRALFKCFGLDNKSQANEEQEPAESATGENPEISDPASTPEPQVADPSEPTEAAADPPSSTPETTV